MFVSICIFGCAGKSCKIIFVTDANSEISRHAYRMGEKMTDMPSLKKDGYAFLGWCSKSKEDNLS